MKSERSSEPLSRWIIVEEDIVPKDFPEDLKEIENFDLAGDLEDPTTRVNTQICAHFEDHELAVCSLNSLMEVESGSSDGAHFQVRTEEGFISVEEEAERVCFIASLH